MATLVQWELVGETKEWVGPLTFTVDGVATTGFSVCVCDGATRPTTWQTADLDPGGSGVAGVLVGHDTNWPIAAGKVYTIFVKFTDTSEEPVMRAGKIKVT